MENPIIGKIKATGIVGEFSKVTNSVISEKYDYMDTVSGVFYKADEIEFQYETVKENYNERYKRIAQTEQFKESYCDKSLGKEEPASEDLEEEITKCYKSRNDLMMTRKQFGDLIYRFTEWQKQQMMKDAVELTITNTSFIPLPKMDIKAGDKAKIIIIKEDQQ